MQKLLWVFLDDNLAGELACDSAGLSFHYSRAWLDNRSFIPLSVTLPHAARRFGHHDTYSYFENLLPESKLRTAVANARGVASDDIFGLLEKLGGDCAGAVSLALPGTVPSRDSRYRAAHPRDVKALVAGCQRIPMLAADPARRATLAGSAQKTSVCFRRGRIYEGIANAPTTHVLKPDSDKLPQSTANEAFCMKLAARAGLPVVDPALVQCGARVLLIARSDRRLERARIRRLHEIDFCQAGNFASATKYEKDGGPGLAQLFALGSRHLEDWPLARAELLKWVIFNYLVGNRDTHAKNLSMRITTDGMRLAPFYDLLSTAVYPGGEKEMSLKVGRQNRAHAVEEGNWRRFSRDIGVGWTEVAAAAREMAAALPRHAEAVAAGMALTRVEKARVNTIMRLLAGQARHLQKSIG